MVFVTFTICCYNIHLYSLVFNYLRINYAMEKMPIYEKQIKNKQIYTYSVMDLEN